tara:strand:- start:246 stop:491 length:246 start_codon:yes stop_codon:yes gene_type:complete
MPNKVTFSSKASPLWNVCSAATRWTHLLDAEEDLETKALLCTHVALKEFFLNDDNVDENVEEEEREEEEEVPHVCCGNVAR